MSSDPATFDPSPWLPDCAEYFRDFFAGRFDDLAQLWFIYRRDQVEPCVERGDLVIGRPGADGMEFCYRQGHAGIWVYCPLEQDHALVAESLAVLEAGWLDGSIKV